VAEIRRWVTESASGSGAPEVKRAVIACWVIYLVILADRPRARSMGRTRGLLTPYPRGGQPPALVEIKNSLYYTSHSAPTPSVASTLDPSARPLLSSPPLRPTCHLTRPLFSSLHPPPSTHHILPLWRRLVRADRLNMRPAIPDGTNIIKVRLHAKPVKYRRPPFSSFDPLYTIRLPRRPFGPRGGLGHSLFFFFTDNLHRLEPN